MIRGRAAPRSRGIGIGPAEFGFARSAKTGKSGLRTRPFGSWRARQRHKRGVDRMARVAPRGEGAGDTGPEARVGETGTTGQMHLFSSVFERGPVCGGFGRLARRGRVRPRFRSGDAEQCHRLGRGPQRRRDDSLLFHRHRPGERQPWRRRPVGHRDVQQGQRQDRRWQGDRHGRRKRRSSIASPSRATTRSRATSSPSRFSRRDIAPSTPRRRTPTSSD